MNDHMEIFDKDFFRYSLTLNLNTQQSSGTTIMERGM